MKARFAPMLLLLLSCNPDEESAIGAAQSGTPPPRAKADSAAADPANASANTEYTYSPVGKRDPFRSYLADLKEATETERSGRLLEATEKFELAQYRLTGLLTGTSQPKAMVEDPNGRGHVVHIGSRMGRNEGRVMRITSTGLVVVEDFRDATGKRMQVPININLPQPGLDTAPER